MKIYACHNIAGFAREGTPFFPLAKEAFVKPTPSFSPALELKSVPTFG